MLLGRDMVRAAAQKHALDPEALLRLEHIVVSHQSPAKVSSSARCGIVLEVTTPRPTPIGESAPITRPSRTRTLP